MKRFILAFLLGLLISSQAISLAQSLSRTTPMAGGPPGVGFLSDYDSGMTTLTNSAALLTSSTVLVTNIYCANTTAGAVTVTITDNQGSPQVYIPTVSMAAHSTQQFINVGKGVQMLGIKWNASAGASINCQIAGYF